MFEGCFQDDLLHHVAVTFRASVLPRSLGVTKVNKDTMPIALLLKIFACEFWPQVSNDSDWRPEVLYPSFDETVCYLKCCFSFRSFPYLKQGPPTYHIDEPMFVAPGILYLNEIYA